MNTKELKIHSGHIEVCVAELLNPRVYTIVPNVHWGLGLSHECDLLCLNKSGYFTEVEIKISLSDLKADFDKEHGHESKIISRLVYAVPEWLLDSAVELCPKTSGIIVIKAQDRFKHGIHLYAEWYRQGKADRSKKPDEKQVLEFMRLGCMRIWSLKKHNNKLVEPKEQKTPA